MFQTWDNSQLLRRVIWVSTKLTIVSSLKHKNTQPLYIFNGVRALHLDRLKEGTWLHSFVFNGSNAEKGRFCIFKNWFLKKTWLQKLRLDSNLVLPRLGNSGIGVHPGSNCAIEFVVFPEIARPIFCCRPILVELHESRKKKLWNLVFKIRFYW